MNIVKLPNGSFINLDNLAFVETRRGEPSPVLRLFFAAPEYADIGAGGTQTLTLDVAGDAAERLTDYLNRIAYVI